MKKYLLATAALISMASAGLALDSTGTNPACSPLANSGSATGLQYCTMSITSGTTSTQLGRFKIYPTKQVTIVGGVSGSAVAGVVTPTISLYLGNRVIATQTVSVSTAGNVVTLGVNGVPYFDGLAVSQSTPSLISATNALSIGVIENTRNQSAQ